MSFIGAGNLDRATVEKFVRTGAARPFFVHRASPVSDSRTLRQIDYTSDRLALPPRYPDSANLAQRARYCCELSLRVLALRKPAH
ncbi:MAG TPA: hypothetical protein VGP04_05025 [Pseudonocardiaceae bacterium]|jgi:hypothetical protein|nr:hypothetical protein [Pseudonocardiaceae bacterium]